MSDGPNTKAGILDGKRLLVVEDDADSATIICQLLRQQGSKTVWASSLEAALSQLCVYGFDAVILDLTLPDAAAVDAVSAITERYPGVPIIVATGSQERELDSIRQGAQEFILKGAACVELTRAICRAIERHKVRPLYMPAFQKLDEFSDRLAAFEKALEECSVVPLSTILT